jgi:hypothetical protein
MWHLSFPILQRSAGGCPDRPLDGGSGGAECRFGHRLDVGLDGAT